MKTFLIVAAALGLTSSVALADCPGHNVTAANKVDKEMTTASIATSSAEGESRDVVVPQVRQVEEPTVSRQ